MLKFACLLALCFTAAVGSPAQQRLVGWSVIDINKYPFAAVMLQNINHNFRHNCGGTIINNRSVVSAAHCFSSRSANNFRIRVGSSFANSGGTVYAVSQIINHPNYNPNTLNNDISVVRVSGIFSFGSRVQPGRIPGSGYNLGDNQAVWAVGWGFTMGGGPPSEQLRHVQIRTIDQNTCRGSYGSRITENMLCAGDMNGGQDSCAQDYGGPLLHNGVLVGVTSYGNGCALPRLPGIYARVNQYTKWIESNR